MATIDGGRQARADLDQAGEARAHGRGRVVRVGECRPRVLGETKPCERVDEALPGLQHAMWPDRGGGAFAEVLDDGTISVGDPVGWEDGATPSARGAG